MLIMPMGPGTYGSQKGRPKKKPTGQLKLNMKKMPPEVQKRLMDAMKKKKPKRSTKGPDLRYNPYGTGSKMNPTRASRTTGP